MIEKHSDLHERRGADAEHGHKALVVLLSTEYGPEVAGVIPHVSYFPERALAYLGRARDVDRLVVVLPEDIGQSAKDYFFEQFFSKQEAEAARRKIELFVVPDGTTGALTKHFLGSPALLEALKCAIGEASEIHVVNAVANEDDQLLAATIGVSLDEVAPDAASKYGTKFGSKTVFGIACVDQPQWSPGTLRDPEDVVHAISSRFETRQSVCVKIDDAAMAGGIGNFYFTRPKDKSPINTDSLEDLLEASSRPFQEFWSLVSTSGCIVEEFIEDAAHFPSALMYVSPTDIDMVSCQQQVIINSHFSGFDIDPTHDLNRKLRRPAFDVAKVLKGLGYQGTVGIDFIETAGGAMKALELNLRKTGVSHVVEYCDGILRKQGRARDHTTCIAYRRGIFAKDCISRDYNRNLAAVAQINSECDGQPGDGAYFINVNSLQLNGFLEYVCIGSNRQQTSDLVSSLTSIFDTNPSHVERVG